MEGLNAEASECIEHEKEHVEGSGIRSVRT
jgi:hypothetical protein